jgi:DNA-binding CsgD family transcriptional regulator
MSPRTHPARNGSTEPAANSAASGTLEPLTPRELEVASWIGQGKGNEAIAKILPCSTPTVKKHVQHLIKKLGVENRTGVCTWWHEHGKYRADLTSAEPR